MCLNIIRCQQVQDKVCNSKKKDDNNLTFFHDVFEIMDRNIIPAYASKGSHSRDVRDCHSDPKPWTKKKTKTLAAEMAGYNKK